MAKPILAIDPGKAGGLVWGSSLRTPSFCKMPDTIHDLKDLLQEICVACPDLEEAWLERITGYMSGMKASYKSGITFGRNIGRLEMGIAMAEISLREITPVSWQKKAGISCSKKSLVTDTQWKNYLKAEAQKRFPKQSTNITLYTADAFLIYYAAHKHQL